MALFCEHCGAKLIKPRKSKKGAIKYIVIGVLILIIIFIVIGIINITNKDTVYFSDDDDDRIATKNKYDEKKSSSQSNSQSNENSNSSGVSSGTSSTSSNNDTGTKKIKTDIEIDHYYYIDLPNAQAADDLIVKDSEDQKGTTANEIKQIESQIIRNYKVKAVNLGEMDVETARGIAKAFEYIYTNYPAARNMLSNISIGNMSVQQGSVLAYFGPHEFAVSTSSTSGYPKSVKTLMCLNSKYFLNPDLLKAAVDTSSNSGHFPKNTNEYATVIHESGHFLTLVATMKKYGLETTHYMDEASMEKYVQVVQDWNANKEPLSIAQEAYENYKKKYNDNISFDEFRASISGYAMAKNSNGDYIYHETIAEAFHDYYINGNNATKASIEIMNVLNSRLQ